MYKYYTVKLVIALSNLIDKTTIGIQTSGTRKVLRQCRRLTLSSNHYFSVIPAQHNIDIMEMVPNDALDIFNLNSMENKITEPTRFGNISSSFFLMHCIER